MFNDCWKNVVVGCFFVMFLLVYFMFMLSLINSSLLLERGFIHNASFFY